MSRKKLAGSGYEIGGPLYNQTWQTECKTAPFAKVQLCEHENQTLEAFVVASRLYAKFNCPVARQKFSTFSYCAWLGNALLSHKSQQ